MSFDARLRIAVVGPTHPQKGGVAAHTTTLAHELSRAGHDVTLVSWTHLYPRLLYPGQQSVPEGGAPDVEPFPRTVRVLSWAKPQSLIAAGRRLRDVDLIVLVHVIPPVVPLHLLLLRAAGVGRVAAGGEGPRAVLIAHNVLPHEPGPGDSALVGAMVRRVDAVLVHSSEQARLAEELGAHRVVVADLPPHLPGGAPERRSAHTGAARLLAMGLVREYKGIDLLMRAMLTVPEVTLTVAGEMWGNAGEAIRALARDPRLAGRVTVLDGYVPADRIAGLLAEHDVLSLTYRSATASQNVLLAHQHGLPVLASRVGTFGHQVRDGVDGLLVPPGDEEALVAALTTLRDRDTVERLRAGVRPPDLSGPWARYVGTLEAAAAAQPEEVDVAAPKGLVAQAAAVAVDGVRLAAARRRPRVELHRRDIPPSVRPTDVLATDDAAAEARAIARALGLPRSRDPLAAWAALGALGAVLSVRDDGRRSALILDDSGPHSPFGRWARAAGFAPLEVASGSLRFGIADLEPGSVDVITRLHPRDLQGGELGGVLDHAGWALRVGGLLTVTVAVGGEGAQAIASPADLRAVAAEAEDAGFALVGDLDGDLTARLRHAADRAATSDPDTAYAIARLTFRRR
ncbi:glycosyltransferase [Janibacter sp. GXQ6167]|uniref:glycosyltransferase n=1 Tax=Janibacter sp. GXQ6167 TaxID=3240791 RepID=UPI0035236683